MSSVGLRGLGWRWRIIMGGEGVDVQDRGGEVFGEGGGGGFGGLHFRRFSYIR